MKRILVASLAIMYLLLSAPHSSAVEAGLEGLSAEKIGIEVRPSREAVIAGSVLQTAVVIEVAEGWHINSHRPTLDYLIGTAIELDPPSGLTVKDIQYPAGTRKAFDFAGTEISVYDGKVPVFVDIQASDSLQPGIYEIPANATVQACDNAVCLAPSTVPFNMEVVVGEEGVTYPPINRELFEGRREGPAEEEELEAPGTVFTARTGGQIAETLAQRGYLVTFLGIFLIGLALNLTPCVYPMVSVTVSLFGGRSSQRSGPGKAFALACLYVLGIASMYSVLGVIAAYTGSLFGHWLQSPWVLAGVGVLMLVLALSMFGLYEIQPPGWLMSRIGGAQRVGGPAGHFLSGLVVGVFAAPCIGPPIIALLLFVGSQGNPLFGFLTMFVMAAGLGLPYLILGTFSGLLGRLPRSGNWLLWVKKVFGVVLTGVALFYLALAFFPAYAAHTIPAVLIGGAIYLALADRTTAGRGLFRYVRWTVVAAAVVIGVLFIWNLRMPGIEWEQYTAAAMHRASENERAVMLYFYADWCVPCLELDRTTFTDAGVIEAASGLKRLKVDLTRYESEHAQQMRERFEVRGVPTIVFLGADGSEQERSVGYVSSERLLQQLENIDQ